MKRILSRHIPKSAKLGALGLLVIIITSAILLSMSKSDMFGGWFGKSILIKISSNDKPRGTWDISGDTTTYSKNYTVRFKEDEKLAIVAELFQVGKPMRNLGCKIFSGSKQPHNLSVMLKRSYRNEEKTSVEHDLKITLNDQIFVLNDVSVETSAFFNNTVWGFFNGSKIVAQKHDGQPYAEFENLLRVRVCPNGGNPRAPRIWMPTYNDMSWIDSDAYFISVNMLALSQLDHLDVDVPHYGEKMQLPDGTYITGNSTKDERKAVAENYLLGLRRALMREQMPLPELSAHKYYNVGDPIHIYIKNVKDSYEWKPTLEEIYHDGDVNPIFFLIDGKEYTSRRGIGPFGHGGETLHLPGDLYIDSSNFHLTPGRHTVAYGWKDLEVINPDEPDRVVHYEKLVTDAIEFEVVEDVPADYYSEIYKEGWEDILRRSIETPFTDDYRNGGVAGALFGLKIKPLPFDIAFEIYAQAEGSEERIYATKVAIKSTKTNPSHHRLGCDHQVKDLNWDTVGQKRWRLILVPSKMVAMQKPPIRHYYGREFVTDWATFDRSPRFQQHRRSFERRKNATQRYAGTIKADKLVDLDQLNRRWRNDDNQPWPIPEGFELGWSDENGGTLRIDPHSNVRMVWFPEANANLVEVKTETRRRLVELPGSRLTEINPPAGELTLIAVQSNEGKIYFVRVQKIKETWANISWWPADSNQISFPIKSLNSSKTNAGGTFEWHTFISPQVRFKHGWYTIEDGVITEHSGGGGSKLPYYGPITLKLNVVVKDNMFNLEMQCKERRDGKAITTTVSDKISVPAGASLKHVESIDSALISYKHLTLWQGDLVRDGRIVKSVVYAVYLISPDKQETGFMSPKLQETDFSPAENNDTVQVGSETHWGKAVNGISVHLGGLEPLGLFFTNNTIWFELKNRSNETIEFSQEPCAQKGTQEALWGYLEISDMNNEAVEYKWRTEKKMWNLKPGKNYKNGFVNGRPLRKSGLGTYRARVTLAVHGLESDKTFEVKSNWYPFEVTPCGYPIDFVPKTAYEQLRQANAYHHMMGFGHATIQEVISRYESIIEKYPDSKYELESHFGIAQAASENRDPSSVTADDYALSRRHYQAIIRQWPDVVTYHTIHARYQAYFQTAEFIKSRRDLYTWLKSLTIEQKIDSMRHYFIWPYKPSDEDVHRAVDSFDKVIAKHISQLEKKY